MGMLKLLFGSPDAAVKTAGTIAKGIDSLVYTDEEKAEHRGKALEWLNKYMESTQGQNLARRYIATIVTLQWALLINIGIFCGLLADTVVKDAAPDKWATRSEFVFKVLNECVNEAFITVLIFYFTARILTGALASKPQK